MLHTPPPGEISAKVRKRLYQHVLDRTGFIVFTPFFFKILIILYYILQKKTIRTPATYSFSNHLLCVRTVPATPAMTRLERTEANFSFDRSAKEKV